jgi:phosphoribosylaminoimidazolecarboxamide formyltransferase/IMP cyclohydrolase
MDIVPVRRALLSVSDKSGLVPFATFLNERGIALLSTGGTARTLTQAGLPVVEIGGLTGFGEILGGRVKTLHPAVHAAILARRELPEDLATLRQLGIEPIDLVVVNLYPFEATVASGAKAADCVEQIDIGGPAMIRAAAKNHGSVAVVIDPADYARVEAEIAASGGTTLALRRALALKAFRRTAAYDAAISAWLGRESDVPPADRLVVAGDCLRTLRYGENPHQKAALYRTGPARPGAATARLLQGKELSYNNILDADAAFEAVAEFDAPAVVIVKHNNPCGAAEADDPLDAWKRALACDPTSAFGGIVAVNRPVDPVLAEEFTRIFLEVVIAPEVRPEAREILARKPALRVLETGALPDRTQPDLLLRSVAGGVLVQSRDAADAAPGDLRVVTQRPPTADELRDLLFAWKLVKHARSNAIVLARGRATVGIGAGQTSRVDAVAIAARKAQAGRGSRPCVVASDAFFPFPDGVLAAIEAGATAVIQPGGSVRDAEVIAAADTHGIAMVFTGIRHFRH